jgi:hypothetical protein
MYDSRKDTEDHMKKVEQMIGYFIYELQGRAAMHDNSKLNSPEKELFDKYTPLLQATTYGSDEYKRHLKEMGVALDHHYENNRHHPEHFAGGVSGMTLVDVVEMFCDWKAASMRHADGDFSMSLEHNRDRFDISQQLHNIFLNTVKLLD